MQWRWKRVQERELTPWEDLSAEMQEDARRFFEHSIPSDGGPERLDDLQGMQLDALATRTYHRVEKGFSLPVTKRPFGAKSVPRLTRTLANPATDQEALYALEAGRALRALEEWNETGTRADDVAPRGDSLPVNPLDPETLATFIASRHSIRDFTPEAPDRALIEEAVRLGGFAPSVCNRQSWRVHYFDDRADIERLLTAHNGSAGFAHAVPGVFVVTYDLRSFESSFERHQGWIDGGLFSMTLLLALHGLGLGAVPLNWSRRNRASRNLRRIASIPEHENIVMMIAVGHPAEGYRVARSARRPVSEILRFGSPSV